MCRQDRLKGDGATRLTDFRLSANASNRRRRWAPNLRFFSNSTNTLCSIIKPVCWLQDSLEITTMCRKPVDATSLNGTQIQVQINVLRCKLKRRRALELEQARLQAVHDLLKMQRFVICVGRESGKYDLADAVSASSTD